MRLRHVIGVPVLILLWAACSAAAPLKVVDKRLERGGVGFKIGVENGTTFRVDSVEYPSNVGLGLGVYFELPLRRRIMLLGAIDFHDIQLRDNRNFMIDVNLGVKPILRYWERSKLAMKVGAAAGFGYLPDIGQMKSTTYLTLRGSAELVFLVSLNYSYLLEFSVLDYPTGGNSDLDVSTKPTVSLRFGIMY